MGILTDFFVASPIELRESFRTWLEVADEPIARDHESIHWAEANCPGMAPATQRPLEKVSAQERFSQLSTLAVRGVQRC